jgi:hypothetical protein
MGKNKESVIDNKLVELFSKEVMQPLFPMWKESFATATVHPDEKKAKSIGLGEFGLNEKNVKSPYFYTGKYQFVHYTSLQNCINIIREKKIRLYSLLSMDDKEEFSYSAETFGTKLNEYDNEDLKKIIFCFSLASYKDEMDKENLDLWRAYAQDGRGVGIVFSMNKRQAKNWVGYALSEVYYQDKSLEKYQEVRERYINFKKMNDFTIENFDMLFYRYHAFHKTKLYKNEREIRLLFFIEDFFNTQTSAFSCMDLNSNGKIRNYFELELESVDESEPNIKIDKILLGYRLNQNNRYSLQQVISQYNEQFKNKIEVDFTILKSHFNKDEK